VGGTGVFVGAGRGVFVRLGRRGAAVGSLGRRVFRGVIVKKILGVSVGVRVSVGVDVALAVTVTVAVGTNSVTDCSVNATAVFKLDIAKSTMFRGTSVAGM
jgi:hypothetical protein